MSWLKVSSDVRTVRLFTLEPYFPNQHTSATSYAFAIGVRRGIFCGVFSRLSNSAADFTSVLIFWFGAYLARSLSFSVKPLCHTDASSAELAAQIEEHGNEAMAGSPDGADIGSRGHFAIGKLLS